MQKKGSNQQKNGPVDPKSRHVWISTRPLSKIRPSPENDKLYRPVSPTDPEIKELAKSIKKHGPKVPLTITLDDYIISGHRRYVACKLAGVTDVPCLVEPILKSDPKFLELLREYNRQRIKSLDEVTREEIVSTDPEEAYRALTEYRQQMAVVHADAFTIDGVKRRSRISKAKMPFLEAVLAVLDGRRKFWPLTDRVIHYGLLDDPPLRHASKPDSRYRNDDKSYDDLTDLVTRARLFGDIPFHAIHDPTRPVQAWNFNRDCSGFIRNEMGGFLKGYYRDLMQSQPNHIEMIGEKNTIDSIIRPVAMNYGIPMTIGRGYCSLPPRYEMAQRFQKSGKEKMILLALSDFDPEGDDIAHSFARSMRDDFGIKQIVPIKVALTADQVQGLKLPPKFKAKEGSSRREGFVERHGSDDVFELEAVRPERMQQILRDAIDSVIDVDAFNAEIDLEKDEAAHLDGVRRSVMAKLGTTGGQDG